MDVAGDRRPEGYRFSRDMMDVFVLLANPTVMYCHCVFGMVAGVGAM